MARVNFWISECKNEMLEKHDIIMTKDMDQEVMSMVSWSEGYYEEGYEKGLEQGLEQGYHKAKIDMIKLMLNNGIKLEAIAFMLNVDIPTLSKLLEDKKEE